MDTIYVQETFLTVIKGVTSVTYKGSIYESDITTIAKKAIDFSHWMNWLPVTGNR